MAVACGSAHTVLLDASGDMWCFGSNDFGQCGLPTANRRCKLAYRRRPFLCQGILRARCLLLLLLLLVCDGKMFPLPLHGWGP